MSHFPRSFYARPLAVRRQFMQEILENPVQDAALAFVIMRSDPSASTQPPLTTLDTIRDPRHGRPPLGAILSFNLVQGTAARQTAGRLGFQIEFKCAPALRPAADQDADARRDFNHGAKEGE